MDDFLNKDNQKIEAGYKIPDQYFHMLQENVFAKIEKIDLKKATPVRHLFTKSSILTIVAASVVICFGIFNFYKTTPNLSAVDSQALYSYIENRPGIDEDLLTRMLAEENIDPTKVAYDVDESAMENELSMNPNVERYITTE